MALWIVEKVDSLHVVVSWEVIATRREVEILLRSLASRNLTDRELIESSKTLLAIKERKGGSGLVLECGQNPYVTARLKNLENPRR